MRTLPPLEDLVLMHGCLPLLAGLLLLARTYRPCPNSIRKTDKHTSSFYTRKRHNHSQTLPSHSPLLTHSLSSRTSSTHSRPAHSPRSLRSKHRKKHRPHAPIKEYDSNGFLLYKMNSTPPYTYPSHYNDMVESRPPLVEGFAGAASSTGAPSPPSPASAPSLFNPSAVEKLKSSNTAWSGTPDTGGM